MIAKTATTLACKLCRLPCQDGRHVDMLDKHGVVVETHCRACYMDACFDEYVTTGKLQSWLMTEVVLRNHDLDHGRAVARANLVREIDACNARLHDAIKAFEHDVWFAGLQAFVRASQFKGASGKVQSTSLGTVSILTYAMAGRAMITLETPNIDVTVITEEASSSSRMGMQGIHATEAEALALLRVVSEAWAGGKITMRDDKEVGL